MGDDREGGAARGGCLVVIIPVLFGVAQPASAFQFQTDDPDFSASFDNTVSVGAAWRTQGRDPALIGIANGGTSRSVNEDNGDLNWPKGSLYALPVYYTGEVEMKYRNLDFFTRFDYLYDQRIDGNDKLGDTAKALDGNDFRLLDFFAGGRWDLTGNSRMLSARVGRQVLNWGESTFIPNGINAINPIDLRRLRSPGSELRNALLPLNTFWMSQDVAPNVTLEGYYQFEWSPTRIDPAGTYFSSNDFASPDGEFVFAGFGRRRDFNQPIVAPLPTATGAVGQVYAPISGQVNAKNSGQFGFAARIFIPSWNNTELGFYGLNYHSRIPVVSGVRGTGSSALGVGSARYFPEFPENINLFGMSFSTPGPWGVALQGEYSYRPNQPLALAGPEVLLATLGGQNSITGTGLTTVGNNRVPIAALVPIGAIIRGYDRVEQQQLQMTATKAFGPTFGADQLTMVGEVGFTYLDLPSGVYFNGPGVFLPAPGSSTTTSYGSVQTTGYATRFSWGYRLLGRLDYPNALGAATVSPRVAFGQDVNGVGPTFNDGAMSLTIGLGFNYRQNWQADIAYTSYFGGRTIAGIDPAPNSPQNPFPAGQSRYYASSTNPLEDRDFFALSVSYSF
jgi:hypothetical protein